jgi:5-formyltetrahydrofolate cyclo-ligase
MTVDNQDPYRVGKEKKALRAKMRRLRKAVASEIRHQAHTEAELWLKNWLGMHRLTLALATVSYGTEFSTEGLIHILRNHGVAVGIIPASADVSPDGPFPIMDSDGGTITCCRPSEADFILVPGLAFDLRGGRLGQGGGFFDRLLAARLPGSFAVGLGYSDQMIPSVPVEPHDQRLDAVWVFPGEPSDGNDEIDH